VAVIVPMLMTLAAHAARAIANVVAGSTWTWAPREELFSALPGLVSGDASTGLPRSTQPTASTDSLMIWLVVVEIAVLVACILAVRWAVRRWGPGRILGMASPAEAEELLGISRVRRNAAVIRPDLYGTGEGQ
jgi:hypothetical protein